MIGIKDILKSLDQLVKTSPEMIGLLKQIVVLLTEISHSAKNLDKG